MLGGGEAGSPGLALAPALEMAEAGAQREQTSISAVGQSHLDNDVIWLRPYLVRPSPLPQLGGAAPAKPTPKAPGFVKPAARHCEQTGQLSQNAFFKVA